MREFGRQAKLASLLDSALDSADDVMGKREAVGLLGLIGHALYYYIWTQVYPQPYEAPELRLALAAMFLAFLCPWRWIRRLQAAWPAFWHLTLTLNLPFFFTYMALRNDSWPWVASLQVALQLVFLLTSGALASLLIAIGMGLGAICAAPFVIDWQTNLVEQAWPVILFGLVAAGLLNRSQQERSQRKTAALLSYAGYIAHEIRTPLASIAARASLTKLGTSAGEEDCEQHLAELSREVERTFGLIDILLTNIDPMRHAPRGADDVRPLPEHALISSVIAEALMRYPFRDAGERERVRVQEMEDCAVCGSPLLLQHVVMNLIRNVFEHCRVGSSVVVDINVRRRAHGCELSIEDNGCGIQAEASSQAGLGLMFCRNVARSIGGELRVLSPSKGGCTVRLSLPSPE